MKLNFKIFKNNNRAEQEIIYDQCHRKLFFTALRILNNQFEAEEVMHDTLLNILDQLVSEAIPIERLNINFKIMK